MYPPPVALAARQREYAARAIRLLRPAGRSAGGVTRSRSTLACSTLPLSHALVTSLLGPDPGVLEEIGHGELAAQPARWEARASRLGCKYRYELGSFCNRPTRTSATMRPPTGPACGPCRRSRPPSGCRTTAGPRRPIPDRRRSALRLCSPRRTRRGGTIATYVADDGDRHVDAVVLRQLGVGERRHAHQLEPPAVPRAGPSSCPGGGSAPRAGLERVGVGQRRRGHLEQRAGQRSVELAHGPGGGCGRRSALKNLLHWIFSRGGTRRGARSSCCQSGASSNSGTLETAPRSLPALSKTSRTV